MKRLKPAFLIVFMLLVAIQFFPIEKNSGISNPQMSFSNLYNPPAAINTILKVSCYDCHSNNTRYPWYRKIQPVGWLLESHIKEGKKALNFDEFGTYTNRKQKSKVKAIFNQVNDDKMPLRSYKALHRDAIMTTEEKNSFLNYFKTVADSINQ